jgi:uncharacterized membrane protein YkoI
LSTGVVAELLTPVAMTIKQAEVKQEILHQTTWATLTSSKLILESSGKQVYEIELVTDKDISRSLIDVGSSF